ncbi:hypothetical protein ACFL6I_18485 [candidate division KSB1 bacterium]
MDSHVHVSFKNSVSDTEKVVRTAIKKNIQFVVLAYHGTTERFGEFLENHRLRTCSITALGEKGNESVAKIRHVGGHIYLIKGQQIDTEQGDIIGWPITEQIDPENKSLDTICNELKAQGALRVLPHPDKEQEEYFSGMIRSKHIDIVEYDNLPKILMYLFLNGSNDLVKKFSKEHKVPLYAGSDTRDPKRIKAHTRLERCSIEKFSRLSKPEQVRDYIFERLSHGRAFIQVDHERLSNFISNYMVHMASAAKNDPKGTFISFGKSRIREMKSVLRTGVSKYLPYNHKQ